MESVQLTTTDGYRLTADLELPDGEARGGVVVCHPHPLYGGNRFDPVVDTVFRAASAAGFAALRFDFRVDHGGGIAERLDLVAAVDELAGRGLTSVAVAGYSFGAGVALTTDDDRIERLIAIAPPLGHVADLTPPAVPTLVLTPRHDQFCPPDVAEPIVAGWTSAEFEIVESADHFLAGHTQAIAARIADWLTTG